MGQFKYDVTGSEETSTSIHDLYTAPSTSLEASTPREGKNCPQDPKKMAGRGDVKEAKQSKNVPGRGAWKTTKSAAIRGISSALNATKSSGIEFLTRVGDHQETSGANTVPLREMILVHPPIVNLRADFINDIMRTKQKATRDAIIATSLLPVAEAFDLLSTVVWPFGGALEIDAVWAISSFRGAKAARSVANRLSGSGDTLTLSFRSEGKGVSWEIPYILSGYMASACHNRNPTRFPLDFRRVPVFMAPGGLLNTHPTAMTSPARYTKTGIYNAPHPSLYNPSPFPSSGDVSHSSSTVYNVPHQFIYHSALQTNYDSPHKVTSDTVQRVDPKLDATERQSATVSHVNLVAPTSE
ncbi:hypothetical protein PROFUN_12907 [Planoprotostelium fungivorum]|uniref:Uncharacterized protein n=1 Tax=Planoprotostelium fungivorum TaxID=1890364 RepID=A0A2P6MWJ9_9EUKA|nr:hypothetical protein PROFUN_12907 [Planoprotostelium fungivorum]